MTSPFERVRIVTLVGAAAATAVGGVARGAAAAPPVQHTMPFDLTTGGAKWSHMSSGQHTAGSNDAVFGTFAYGINDANLTNGGTSITDALDGGLQARVDGTVFKDADGKVDVTGTKVRATNTMGSTAVTVDYLFHKSLPMVRALFSFKNTSSAPITIDVEIGSNFGSEGATVITGSENGDATIIDPTDSWFVASGDTDPVKLIARGDGWGPMTATPGGSDSYIEDRSITIKPHKTKRVLMFIRLTTDVPTAVTAGPKFNKGRSIPNGFLAGLSKKTKRQIINWHGL